MGHCGVLTREEIIEAQKDGNLIIDPFEETHLQPTSYDISADQLLDEESLCDFDSLTLAHLGSMNLISLERMEFPSDMIGHIYLRSTFRVQGLRGDLGRIEAGWRGKLVIEVFNTGRPIVIDKGDRLATIEFVKLAKPVSRGYEGVFQDFGSSA